MRIHSDSFTHGGPLPAEFALGAPEGFTLHVRDLIPKTGAGFIVALTGAVMTMPGLPKQPGALRMDVDDDGGAVGLF